MKRFIFVVLIFTLFYGVTGFAAGFTVDHNSSDLTQIPDEWITKAKQDLHIAYNHTSHGSQLITGMNALENFPAFGNKYAWTDTSTGEASSLSLNDRGIPGIADLSQGDSDYDHDEIAQWAEDTYDFLVDSSNYHINVVMWSWCNIGGHNIPLYLNSMQWLIDQFSVGGSHARAVAHPVDFVYMTAHANGGGEDDSADSRNKQIRDYCSSHDCILFDFSDLENYDPDDNYYLDKLLQDDLDYDSDNSGYVDKNWASEYLGRHPDSEIYKLTKGDGLYSGAGSCAHSDGPDNDARLNCVLKGRAAWYLFARLAGWNPDVQEQFTLSYSAGVNGSISGTSSQTVNYGSNGTVVEAIPASNYHFVNWSDSSTENPRTDTGVTANINVTANFSIDMYTVTPAVTGGGVISPSVPQTIEYSQAVQFNLTPDKGYYIDHITETCGGSLSGNTFTTKPITEDCTVVSTFMNNIVETSFPWTMFFPAITRGKQSPEW